MRKPNIEPYSPLKPTKVGFIFIGINSLCQAEDLAAVNHVTQAVVRVMGRRLGLKVGFKELRLEPKVLTRGPRLVSIKCLFLKIIYNLIINFYRCSVL